MTAKKILSVEAAEELVNEVKRLKDALISREMRVRELETTLASIVQCQVEDVDGCGACVDAARLALNS